MLSILIKNYAIQKAGYKMIDVLLIEDHERYVEEHINDPEFKEAELSPEAKKKEEETRKKIEAAKKELKKRLKDDN